MKKASGFYADSLEMLLDTMCNVLGGVVFITLTLALLVRSSPAPAAAPSPEQAAELANELSAATSSNAWLKTELERLQDAHQQLQTNHMRLPNTTETTKQPWPVIVRYGRLYPLSLLSSPNPNLNPPSTRDGIIQNTRSIEWQRLRGQGDFVEPRWGQGDEPESGVTDMVQAFRTHSRTNFYFAFSVYEDSFDAFNRAKEAAVSLGFQYGWQPLIRNTRLSLGPSPEKIPPQN